MLETDLYPPVRDHLLQQGFAVDSEARHCDVVAVKEHDGDTTIVIVELKTSPNLKLLIQATDRQRLTREVLIAVPEPTRVNNHWRGIERLLRQLGLGLILVKQTPLGMSAYRKIKPAYAGAIDPKARAGLQEELAGRSMIFNKGGSTGTKILTAYKETAIIIAAILNHLGPQSVKTLKQFSGDKTQGILQHNHYGWFQRVSRGIYGLTPAGQEALREFSELHRHALNLLP